MSDGVVISCRLKGASMVGVSVSFQGLATESVRVTAAPDSVEVVASIEPGLLGVLVGGPLVVRASIGVSGCDTETDPQELTMVVAWSTGATETWVLDKCGVAPSGGSVTPTGICQVFAAPDLNDEGRAELAVKVQQAAGSISILQVYELTPGEPTRAPVQIAPGGPRPGEITPGQVFVITYGSSPDYEENVRCTTDSEGEPVFLVTAWSPHTRQVR